jgi:site-specific recombinase XerD
VPVESAEPVHVKHYIDLLLENRLAPQTINGHIVAIRSFYYYLLDEEGLEVTNPAVRGLALRLPNPLPRHLQDHQIATFFSSISKKRDLAMFMLMLRCGLRVEEVANLTLGAIDYGRSQIMVRCGKGSKDRIVYINVDAAEALAAYLQSRPAVSEQKIFLVEKGVYKDKPISVRGIQKRIEYYSRKSGIQVSCHQLRHTMATQLLNAGTDLVTLQYLLGHSRIKTTMRYARLSNQKARNDYYSAIAKVEKTSGTTVTWNMRC